MHPTLQHDSDDLAAILRQTLDTALQFLSTLSERPVGVAVPPFDTATLPSLGLGAERTLELFGQKYAAALTGSAGPRYWGFVTGGSTPAALAGDWLVSAFDQNPTGNTEPTAVQVEHDAINLLRQLFSLSAAHSGTFVSGATMANFVGLAIARQWIAKQAGIDVSQEGLYGLPAITILSGMPHSSVYKASSMLGIGRRSIRLVPVIPDREAINVAELRRLLESLDGAPCIVIGNAGTVNTVDFDDLAAIADLKHDFNFWLHVDAAFGGFAACSPQHKHLLNGLDEADSITIDAHKWLNVPYDSAMQFTRHRALQAEVFQNSAAYLGELNDDPEFVHLTPENSRRWRALPAWFTLMAYGAEGYRDIVERDCALAQALGGRIAQADEFVLLAPVRLNTVCFTLAGQPSKDAISHYLDALRATGQVFMTPTVYAGVPAIRAAFSNWRTEQQDVERAWQAMLQTAQHAYTQQTR